MVFSLGTRLIFNMQRSFCCVLVLLCLITSTKMVQLQANNTRRVCDFMLDGPTNRLVPRSSALLGHGYVVYVLN